MSRQVGFICFRLWFTEFIGLWTVCAEAYNPDEDEEEREPRVSGLSKPAIEMLRWQSSSSCIHFCGICCPVSHHALLCLQVTHPKTDEQRQRLQEACKDILLFKNLDQVRLSTVYERIKSKFWLICFQTITKINMDGLFSSCATGYWGKNAKNIEKFYKKKKKLSFKLQ